MVCPADGGENAAIASTSDCTLASVSTLPLAQICSTRRLEPTYQSLTIALSLVPITLTSRLLPAFRNQIWSCRTFEPHCNKSLTFEVLTASAMSFLPSVYVCPVIGLTAVSCFSMPNSPYCIGEKK